ncbi:MAG: SGNH/GDSL hydrolase N-terminal domain-containing protein [Planctomycetota bacterium]
MRSLTPALTLLALGLAGAVAGSTPPATAVGLSAPSEWAWTELADLDVDGHGWDTGTEPFERLPSKYAERLDPATWSASRAPAGLSVDFATDSPRLTLAWVANPVASQAPLGPDGFDLYLRSGVAWRHVRVLAPRGEPGSAEAIVVFDGLPSEERVFRLYLPLGSRVSDVRLGVDPTASLESWTAPARAGEHPVVLFGGLDAAGAGASRAGRALPAQLARRIDRDVLNLGLPSERLLDLDFGALLAELNACLFVFDLMRDVDAETLGEGLEPFINGLRRARPWASVLVIDAPDPPAAALDPALAAEFARRRETQRRVVDELGANGVVGVYHLQADGLVGEGDEWSADGWLRGDVGLDHSVELLVEGLRPILGAWENRGE